MDLKDSLAALDDVYEKLMAVDGGPEALDMQLFADAWDGCRHFRDQSLLVLARYAYSAVYSQDMSCQDVARRLVDFSFQLLPRRQIAFAFDLTSTLLDMDEFGEAVLEYGPQSRFFSKSKLAAAKGGITGSYLFDPESLVNMEKLGVDSYNPNSGSDLKERAQRAILASASPVESLFGGLDILDSIKNTDPLSLMDELKKPAVGGENLFDDTSDVNLFRSLEIPSYGASESDRTVSEQIDKLGQDLATNTLHDQD